MNSSAHFLAIISDEKVIEKYMGQLKAISATSDVIKKLEDLSKIPAHIKYNGIIIDIHTLLRLPRLDRAFIKSYTSGIPTLKFVYDVKNDAIAITYLSIDGINEKDFNGFIKKCSHISANAIRHERRYNIILNAIKDDEKYNISNISSKGCFVMSTTTWHRIGEEVLLTIKEIKDETPIPCIIHRVVEWGSKELAAGIGVEFLSMTEIQRAELEIILKGCELQMEKDLQDDTY